jgi:hypothetical protein
MNPSRYNSFNQIHKGLRAMLYDAALTLQQTDLADKETGEKSIKKVEDVLLLFESHAHNEDRFFNEPLEATHPEVASMFEQEHEEDHRLALVLKDLLERWRSEQSPTGRRITGRNLYYAFNEFIAFNLYHMNKEEIELNEALWKAYTDEQIKVTEQKLVQQTPPQKMMMYAKWMIRGINDSELVTWLAEVRTHAPAEVFSMLMGIAEKELTEERLGNVKAGVEKYQHVAA